MIIYLITSVIIEAKDRLEQQAFNEDQSSAVYVVFRTPLEFLGDVEVIDNVMIRALRIEQEVSLYTLIDQGRRYKGIDFTIRAESPFNQLYNGQNLGFEESLSAK